MTLKITCTKCGGDTRLAGIEPHQTISGVEIWTLECTRCGHIEAATPGQAGAALTLPAQNAQGLR